MMLFLRKILLFSLIITSLLVIAELGVPSTFTTFRSWEANKSTSPFIVGEFYPNQNSTRNEVGDLAHHTKWQISKENINWVTDSLGFRNRKFTKNIDILFIGASNIAGSSISQENILSEVVGKKTGHTTYNIAPSDFQDFVSLIKKGIISPPKILFYGNIERSIPSFKKISPKKTISSKQKLKNKLQKIVPVGLSSNYDKLRKGNTKLFIKARLTNNVGKGIQSSIENKMFFLQGRKALIDDGNVAIKKTAEIIKSYSNYCDSIGVKFVFFPIPNKETIYFDLVPFKKQPTYLEDLIKELSKREVEVINTIEIFNLEKEHNLLYHFDDSHWNENGINTISNKIIQLTTMYIR